MSDLKVAAAAAIGAAVMLAGTAASAAPDFSGVWQVEPFYSTGTERIRTVDGLPLPIAPAAKAELDYLNKRDEEGKFIVHNTMLGWPKGFIQASRGRFNFKIIQQPKQVTFFFEEDHQYDIFHIDAKHPAHVEPSFLGDSVAHWEGDTLVVDTIGYNGLTALNNVQMSDKTHTTMRLRLVNDGKSLENIITFDDPVDFTRPFQMKIVYGRRPNERIHESVYAENERDLQDLNDQ
ncbi:MAG TPA: hypothetical protein VL358_14150 [Caulobacteraceae bacterium]|jgi:hypothetical protein|nr:hypothetical protein [Caulobacteraceae bacterium]